MAYNWWRHPVINSHDWTWTNAHSNKQKGRWWQNATIYQIFPWSFADSTGNGVGDLIGVIDKLPYIRSLGVEAIWINPIYPSKQDDAGYDATTLDDIDPLFGDLDIFQTLLSIAHDLGLKVLLDQVWSHTADTHPWFIESACNDNNAKSNWYVWADGYKDDPPNNWLSAFTGKSAWIWHEAREQYYLANFMPSQPDLNWHNDDVINALMEKARFWLELGVDGFRIDAVNFFVHDPDLQDNPLRSEEHDDPDGIDRENPMASQLFTHSFCREETLEKLKHIREMMDDFPDRVTLGEVTLCEDSIALSGQYVGNKKLHLAYNSALLWDFPLSVSQLRKQLDHVQQSFPAGGQCWMVGNHDYQRLKERWTGKDEHGNPYPDSFYKMVAAMLIALPGALCLYQGDELGLPLAKVPDDIAPEELHDPFGKALYPKLPGRDGSRTPIPWQHNAKNAGFTIADKPWLPIPKSHIELSVDLQNRNPDSLLNTWRKLLQWRVAQPALVAGDYAALDEADNVLAFRRVYAEQVLYCLFNFSNDQQAFDMKQWNKGWQPFLINQLHLRHDDNVIQLAPYGAVFLSEINKEG